MIIGFGKTETDNEIKELTTVFEQIKEIIYKNTNGYFSDTVIDNVKKAVSKRSEFTQTQGEIYKKQKRGTAPNRYYYHWTNVIDNSANRIIIIFSFHHINRNHGLSPDGWALLTREVLLEVKVNYIDEKVVGNIYEYKERIQ